MTVAANSCHVKARSITIIDPRPRRTRSFLVSLGLRSIAGDENCPACGRRELSIVVLTEVHRGRWNVPGEMSQAATSSASIKGDVYHNSSSRAIVG